MRGFRPFKPYRYRPLCFLDVEGTGLKPGWHQVSEVGMKHSEKGALCIQIAPLNMERAQPEALRISGYNSSDWAEAITFKAAVPKITEFAEDATLIGHNIFGYDIPMLKGEYKAHGLDHDHLFRDLIDTMSLARQFLVKHGLKRVGMEACMKFIGHPYDDGHNAYMDALYAEALYNFIDERLKWHGERDGKKIQENLF